MNVNFKVYWNNPIDMVTEAGTQQLTFEVPLGAIIPNPSGGGDLTNYYTKAETDTEITNAVSNKADTSYVDTEITTLQTTLQENIDTKADISYVDSQDGLLQTAINTKADAASVTQSLSTKADLVGGVIPANQLPSFVDDVLEYNNLASFPLTGEASKIYVAIDTNKTYRWSSTQYVEIGGGVALGETAATAYRGDRGKIAYDHSQSQGNPHNTAASEILLNGVSFSNTSKVANGDNLSIVAGKLQGQLDLVAPPVWIPASTVGVGATGLDISLLEFAKIDGMLFCRGFVKIGSNIPSTVPFFSITNNDYKVIRPIVGSTETLSGNMQIFSGGSTTNNLRFLITGSSTNTENSQTSIQKLQCTTSLSISTEYFAVQHNFCFGQLVNP